MNEQQLSKILQQSPVPQRMAETQALCRDLLPRPCIGFWQFLSDVLPFVGLRLWGLQAVTVLLCLRNLTPQGLSWFAPLLVLACLPSLYESRIYTMYEVESATRASGARLLLGKLVLAGAANLVGLTLAIGLRMGGETGLMELILYALVPFLCCTCVTLRSLRTGRARTEWLSVILCVAVSALAIPLSLLLPKLYTRAALWLWGLGFGAFGGFFLKELLLLLGQYEKGTVYGIIDT